MRDLLHLHSNHSSSSESSSSDQSDSLKAACVRTLLPRLGLPSATRLASSSNASPSDGDAQPRPLFVSADVAMRPHPHKEATGGEDAYALFLPPLRPQPLQELKQQLPAGWTLANTRTIADGENLEWNWFAVLAVADGVGSWSFEKV